MAIFALFQGISAKSGLAEPFSTDWCRVDGINWGVNRAVADTARAGAQDVSLGIANLQRFHLSKPTDGASAPLFAKAIGGSVIGSVIVAIANDGSNKTEVAFKLDRAFIVSAQFASAGGDSPREELEIAFSRLAMGVLTPAGMQFSTWDVVQNKPWTEAAAAFSVDTRWGIRVK
jgi:type VI protein secretion system component Hcp